MPRSVNGYPPGETSVEWKEVAAPMPNVECLDATPFFSPVNSLNQYTTGHNKAVVYGSEHEIANYAEVTYSYLGDTYLSSVWALDPVQAGVVNDYELGYDALGRCVKRTFNGVTTYSIYDGDKPILEVSPDGTVSASTVYGRGIDEILYRNNYGTGEYFLQDRNGNTLAVAGGDGTILEYYRYDAFGNPTFFTPNHVGNDTTLINNRFLFTGREYDAKFGFYEYRARAYNPELGRFMSEDPKGFDAGDYNLYRYCHNDPEDLTDPMGLDPQVVDSTVDFVSVRAAINTLRVSESNSDGAGAHLERMVSIGVSGNRASVSPQMNAGRSIGNGRQSTEMPDPPNGTTFAASAHNHTNDARTDINGNRTPNGSILSPHDRKSLGDGTGKPVYVATKDSKTGKTVVERYRPSDSQATRDLQQGRDSATEALSPKSIEQALDPKKVPQEMIWRKVGN